MLADLKVLEDKLYYPDTLRQFNEVPLHIFQKYPPHEVIKQLNKASKKETRERFRRYLSKLASSDHYRDLLLACLAEEGCTPTLMQRSGRSSSST